MHAWITLQSENGLSSVVLPVFFGHECVICVMYLMQDQLLTHLLPRVIW